MSHEHPPSELTREDLFKPIGKSVIYKYLVEPFHALIDTPVTLFKEKIVDSVRKPHYYYHRRYPRVKTIDECQMEDYPCRMEANEQYLRDKMVDRQILLLLRRQLDECNRYYDHDRQDVNEYCKKYRVEYEEAAINFHIKHEDFRITDKALGAYMKQKHRMLWERRYGPIGTGKNSETSYKDPEDAERRNNPVYKDMFEASRNNWVDAVPKEMKI